MAQRGVQAMGTTTMTVRAGPRARQVPSSPRQLALGIEAAVLALSIIFSWFLSATFVNAAWSLVAMVNFLWLATLLFRIEPRATVLVLPELIIRASTVVAMIFIEYGSPIPELAMVGNAGPYSSAFVFYMFVLFASYAGAFRLFVGPPGRLGGGPLSPLFDRYANLVAAGVLALVGFVILWLVVRGLISGFPLLAGVDRFVYRRLMGDKITLYSLNLKFVILFVLGMVAFRLPTIRLFRLTAIAAAALLMAIYFLFADKFFTQLVAFSGFMAPYLYVNYQKVRRYLIVYVVGAAMALGLVFSMTWYIYSNAGALTPAATMERLSGRVVGQGELWFLQSQLGAEPLDWNNEYVRRNIDALSVQQVDLYAIQQSIGPSYFSNRYAPDWLRDSLRRNAGTVTYTAALEPLGLATFGWVGLAGMMMLVGVLMSLSATYLAFAITSRSIISAVFAGYIAVQLRTTLTQGAPWVLFSIFSLKWLAVVAFIEIGLYVVGVSQRRTRDLRSSRPAAPRGG